MHIIVIIAVIISLSLSAGRVVTAPLLGTAVAGYLLVAAGIGCFAGRLGQRLDAGGAGMEPRVLRLRNRLGLAGRVWLLGGLAGLMYIGWGTSVRSVIESHLGRVPLLAVAVVLLPFFAAAILIWALDYPFHRAYRRLVAARTPATTPCWSRREYVTFHIRHELLFIAVPVGLILLLTDGVYLIGERLPPGPAWEIAVEVASVGCALGVFVIAPLLVVRIWRTRRLEEGPVRDRLEELCRQMGVNYRDILVWESGGVLANAGAMGLLRTVRYVLISDALLANLPVEQIRAIFAHELAHIRHHHIFFAGMFAISAVLLSLSAAWGVTIALGLDEWTLQTMSLFLLAAAWMWGFGFISRRFERQSDVEAAWACSPGRPQRGGTDIDPQGAACFAESLSQVARLNGIPPQKRNWRHGRIADRVDYVLALAREGRTRREIDRTVNRIRLGLLAGLLIGIASLTLLSLRAPLP